LLAGAVTGSFFPIVYAIVESIMVRPYATFLNALIVAASSNWGFSTQTGFVLASVLIVTVSLVCWLGGTVRLDLREDRQSHFETRLSDLDGLWICSVSAVWCTTRISKR